jgi:phosphopantothenoylcysteine decarboxylase / phosphopantothenate---cysteine ligase
MHIIVTAGPTREYLDDVRFLSNGSSGRMGYAIARAAAKTGHSVDLISGPVNLKAPVGVRVTQVMSTREMYDAARKLWPKADAIIGAAAPADYTPAKRVRGKGKKKADGLRLEMKPTVDILGSLGKRKGKRAIIAFALEVQQPLANAIAKMKRKRADAIILNAPAAMGARRQDATLITANGDKEELKDATKECLAKKVVVLLEDIVSTTL